MSDKKVGHGGTRKYGRNKERCAAYRTHQTGEKNKLRRVRRSSGPKAAQQYASLHGLTGYLASLTAA